MSITCSARRRLKHRHRGHAGKVPRRLRKTLRTEQGLPNHNRVRVPQLRIRETRTPKRRMRPHRLLGTRLEAMPNRSHRTKKPNNKTQLTPPSTETNIPTQISTCVIQKYVLQPSFSEHAQSLTMSNHQTGQRSHSLNKFKACLRIFVSFFFLFSASSRDRYIFSLGVLALCSILSEILESLKKCSRKICCHRSS